MGGGVVKVHGYKVQKTWMSEQMCRLDNHTSELKSIFCDTIAGVEYYHALFESMALSLLVAGECTGTCSMNYSLDRQLGKD